MRAKIKTSKQGKNLRITPDQTFDDFVKETTMEWKSKVILNVSGPTNFNKRYSQAKGVVLLLPSLLGRVNRYDAGHSI